MLSNRIIYFFNLLMLFLLTTIRKYLPSLPFFLYPTLYNVAESEGLGLFSLFLFNI